MERQNLLHGLQRLTAGLCILLLTVSQSQQVGEDVSWKLLVYSTDPIFY